MCLDLPGMQGHFNERKCYLPVLERGIKGSSRLGLLILKLAQIRS